MIEEKLEENEVKEVDEIEANAANVQQSEVMEDPPVRAGGGTGVPEKNK